MGIQTDMLRMLKILEMMANSLDEEIPMSDGELLLLSPVLDEIEAFKTELKRRYEKLGNDPQEALCKKLLEPWPIPKDVNDRQKSNKNT